VTFRFPPPTAERTNMTPSAAPRVLCYAPSNRWVVHGQWDMTIMHGLRMRGAEIRYVMCDGLFSDCDVHWAAVDPRPADACLRCQAGTATLAADNGMPYEWLGRSLDPEESREARRWVTSLGRDELLGAVYGDWAVAEWITGSVHSHFRRSRLDVAEPEIERAVRSYLYSGLIAAFALDRLLDDYAPEAMLLFNGRQSSTRVAFELARSRGIRAICHERGPRRGTMRLTANRTIIAREQFSEYWREWGDIPLTASELEAVTGHLSERERGVNTGCVAFSPVPQEHDDVRLGLGLRSDRPAWMLFTSSDDEVAAEPDWRTGWVQTEWVAQTIEYARRHPELDLVIRLHPNTGSRNSVGANVRQLADLTALRADLPANVRWVAPDDQISSYTLMELGTVGLVSHSTVGLEMACKGKRVIVTAPSAVVDTPFVHTAQEPGAYDRALDAALALAPGSVDEDVRRLAHRFAYGMFFRMPVEFPLVASGADAAGTTNWNSPDELVPGRDAGLDRCTAIVLDSEPVCLPPGAADRARDPDAERRVLVAPRGIVVLGHAEELIADVSLLRIWGDSFSADDDATLVIRTPVSATDALVAAVVELGLEADDAPDMLAVGEDAGELDAAVAVLSRHAEIGLPRLDSVAALRAFARA
jgi:hypothetical protein